MYLFQGYETYVVEDASKPIADSTAQQARADMESKGRQLLSYYCILQLQ